MAKRRVKGLLFLEYVRLIRANKNIPWRDVLEAEDQKWLEAYVDPAAWYEMETFERLGLAILEHLAGSDLDQIRRWGRDSIDHLHATEPYLVAANDPRETFMRFQTLRQALFDFHAVVVRSILDGKVVVEVDYGMSKRAEQAAAHQTLGFLARLLELSGAEEIDAKIISRTWEGDPNTTIAVTWS